MTDKQFDTYRFSVKTQVKFNDIWYQIDGVNFERRKISMKGKDYWYFASEIEDIKE